MNGFVRASTKGFSTHEEEGLQEEVSRVAVDNHRRLPPPAPDALPTFDRKHHGLR